MEVNKLVTEALNKLEDEKQDIENRIALINSIDWTQPVTEDTWHELCETPLRYSPLLNVLVKNLFPDATDIVRGANYVNFRLYGYKIQIPTSRARGINVATDWYIDTSYKREYRTPMHSRRMIKMKEYFDAVDNKLGWKAEATARLGDNWRTPHLFLMWFCNYKWHNVDREGFEREWLREEKEYNATTERIEQKEAENRKRLHFVLNTLLPELNKFSTKHYAYWNELHHKTLEDICKKEGIFL